MRGMSAATGVPVDGMAHLYQSIRDILTTPIGTRVMRRDYGSELPFLVDLPSNRETFARIVGAVADALIKWEPRLRLTQCTIESVDTQGRISLVLEGYIKVTGGKFRMEGLIIN